MAIHHHLQPLGKVLERALQRGWDRLRDSLAARRWGTRPSGSSPYLFEVRDPTAILVRLHEFRWRHIGRRHPEVVDLAALRQVIEQAECITVDANDQCIHHYYRQDTTFCNLYLHVVVRQEYPAATILTAYYTDCLTKGHLRWLRVHRTL